MTIRIMSNVSTIELNGKGSALPTIATFQNFQPMGKCILLEILEFQVQDVWDEPDNIKFSLQVTEQEKWHKFFDPWNHPVLKEITSILFTGYTT